MPNRLSLTEASSRIREGSLSPLELLRACLARIDALEDRLHAWVTLDREAAEKAAAEREEELRRGSCRGPLHGIPIGIKDIIYTRGLRTTGGSKFLKDFVPDFDATVVARLRAAGAVILGKTVTTEYACFDPAETRNPWDLSHTPGGSSSGSAAAVACRMCPAALGSQTGGSIARPAAYCGVVGLKPTYGRVSVRGVLPVSFSLDHVGILARSVGDVALILEAIAGADPDDPLCSDLPVPGYAQAASRPPETPPRIGLVRTYFMENADTNLRDATTRAAETFRSCGAKVIEVGLPTSFDDVHRMHRLIMYAEAAAYHANRFGCRRNDFRPGLRALIEEGLLLPAAAYADARLHQLTFRSQIRAAFNKVDVLLTPATPTPAPPGLDSTGDPAFNAPWSYAGLPTVVLPTGLTPGGLPVGVQLVGRPFAEAELLTVARWCQAGLRFEAAPELQ